MFPSGQSSIMLAGAPHIKPRQQIDLSGGYRVLQLLNNPLDRALYDNMPICLEDSFQMLPADGVQATQADRPDRS